MSDAKSGFTFGQPPEAADDDIADIDAIEVSGEPVSRSEAKNLGFVQFDTSREAKASSAMFRLEQLPSDISGDLSKKLETAWRHLKRNEIDDALTLAQEVVWEYPSLVAAKVIIARCFVNRKEYAKALNILQAVGSSDLTAETHYYVALCQSRLGKLKEAQDALKQAKALPADPVTRKRLTDLTLQLQGEHVVCPVCGKKVLYDSMVEVGDQTVCANCAKNMPAEDAEGELGDGEEDDDDDLEDASAGKRRKRLRPPLTRADILMRVVFAVFLLALLALGVWAMPFVAPEYYATFRSFLPADWTFLPSAGSVSSISDIENQAARQQERQQPTLTFDSPPLVHAVAGVELRHHAFIQGMEKRAGRYTVAFSPPPAGKFAFDETSGELLWTPAEQDAGKSFTITFGASFNNVRAREQANTVAVGSGPRFRSLHSLDASPPGEIIHLLAVDMNQDGGQEIIVVSGQFWEGRITTLAETSEGFFQPLSLAAFPGRPAGAGVVMAESETWLAVADYWNSRLRHYALRDGNISEVAVDVDLPGRPLLAGFDRDSSMSALVCRLGDRLELICYRQQGQLQIDKVGQWPLPDENVWKNIFILPGDDEGGRQPLPVLIGGDAILQVDIANGTLVPLDIGVPGAIVNAAAGPDGRLHCLVEDKGRLSLIAFSPSLNGRAGNVGVSAAGPAPALGGMAAVGFHARESGHDVAVFSSGRIGVAFSRADGSFTDVAWWDLPGPFRLFGPAVAAPTSQTHPARVFYIDEAGNLWRMNMADGGGAK